jgi:DNA-binding NtrC family response regulator
MSKPTVLVVEDESALRDLLERVLTIAGYTVLLAERGDEALALVKAADSGPSILLTDVILPGMNGHDLAREIIRLYPATRVAFITGWFDPDPVPLGMCSSCWCLLLKPFSISELTSFVERIACEPTCQGLLYGNHDDLPSAVDKPNGTPTGVRRKLYS